MKKSILIISSLLLVALVAGSVFAWGPGQGMGMGFGPNPDCPRYGGQSAWNDLSGEQRDELTALRRQFIDETYELRSAKFQKHQEMRMLMETSNPDKAKLNELSREISDLQKQVMDKQIDFQMGAKKIAPELDMGAGFGQDGRTGKGCRRDFQGWGCGGGYNN